MAGRILIRGQVAWASRSWGADQAAPTVVPRDRHGNVVSLTPIVAEHPDSPLRGGHPVHDLEEDIIYRQFPRMVVREGWGTWGFWVKRWQCEPRLVLDMVRRGWLDPALDAAGVKRYRCRDEQRCLAYLVALRRLKRTKLVRHG